MSAYTCRKPATFANATALVVTNSATFAGKKYMPGDTIPAEAIPADRVGAVIRMGLVAERKDATETARAAQDGPQSDGGIVIPIVRDGTTYDVTASRESIQTAAAVLQLIVDQATARIAEITDDTALVLIHGLDSRKAVKAAAESRAKAIGGEAE